MYIILSKYLQNQNMVLPNVFIGLFANAVNVLLHYIFIYVLEWGTKWVTSGFEYCDVINVVCICVYSGSAIAQTLAYIVLCLGTFLYIVITGCYKESWGGKSIINWRVHARMSDVHVCIAVFASRLVNSLPSGLGKVYAFVSSWHAHALYGVVGFRNRCFSHG